MDWIFILLYLLGQIALGIYLSRFVESEGDFFLAGRNLPTYAISFSIFATWFGAETCIGSSAAVFSQGLSGSKAEPFGYGMCLLIMAFFIAPRLWNEKYMTLGDFFKDRFGTTTEKLAILILVPSSLIWAAAQVRAFGQVLSATTQLDVNTAIVVATGFVIIYTLLGGLLGDIVTDVIQGGILAITLLIVLILSLGEVDITSAFSQMPASKLSFLSENETFWERLDSWLIPIFGSLIAQELIARVLSSKNKDQARRASFHGMWMYLLFGSIPIILGLLGSQFSLELSNSEEFLPTLAKTILPNWLYIVFAGALISAILSTVDSILLAISALISHNVIAPYFNITSPINQLRLARSVLVISGLIAFILAVMGESVYDMVETASSFGTTGIVVITLGGLLVKSGNEILANICLVSGLVFSILLEYVLHVPASFSLNLLLVTFFFIIFNSFTPLSITRKTV